jgi:basic membrane protein A
LTVKGRAGTGQYAQKADVVLGAGQTGIGVFQAAQEQGKYAIGVDSDQATFLMDTNPDQAEHILTSMVKHVDYSLFRAVVLHLNGELPYGTLEELGVAGGGVGLAKNDIYDEATPGHVKDLVNAAEEAMINGEIPMNSAFGEYPAPVGLSCDQMPATNFDVSKYLD